MYPKILDFRPVTMAMFTMTLARTCICPMVRFCLLSFRLNSLHAGKIFMLLLSSADFFQNFVFITIFQVHSQSDKTVWIQIRTNVLLVLTGSNLFAKAISG